MSILPLTSFALFPDTNKIDPPVPSVLAPAFSTIFPAVVAALPTFNEIPPDAPSMLEPVAMVNAPEAPVLAVPVLI